MYGKQQSNWDATITDFHFSNKMYIEWMPALCLYDRDLELFLLQQR